MEYRELNEKNVLETLKKSTNIVKPEYASSVSFIPDNTGVKPILIDLSQQSPFEIQFLLGQLKVAHEN